MNLADLIARGCRLEARGDSLRVEAPAGLLTEDDWLELARRKPELLRLLHEAELPADPADWREGVRAVMEMYLARVELGGLGLNPAEAEQRVRQEWRKFCLQGQPEFRLVIGPPRST